MKKKIVHTAKAPQPIGPYSQAVAANGLLFVSGQIAINPATGAMNMDNLETETRQVMDNLSAVLESAGASFDNIVKTTIFLSDMGLFAQVNEIYNSYFSGNFPARETVAVKGLPKNVNVEISVIAQLI
ncbi:MAG: RidA family protein [Chitinophagaceae bacterium]|nr:RidA family protein [Bacteroidota bacterium]MCC6258445.1 RidA family protein [Chitinophagaceae bacterium]MCW5916566.1 RidA family protein [Ferruginibacter sp.]